MKAAKTFCLYLVLFFSTFVKGIFPQCEEINCLGYYQENNPATIISHYHDSVNGGNCIGYAIASTQQSYLGSFCGLAKSISIDEAYAKNYWMTWGFYDKFGFSGSVQTNDILIWDSEPNN